jgi:hypothetical protein
MKTDLFANDHDLGYFLYPHPFSNASAYKRLDINIFEQPTERHFDPEQVCLYVFSQDGYVEQFNITHPWTLGQEFRAVAGRVILEDRLNQQVATFTLGGRLRIRSQRHCTICTLESSAPIFMLRDFNDLSYRLVNEIEIYLAEQRAEHALDPEVYDQFLANTPPISLYISILKSILQKLRFAEEDTGYFAELLSYLEIELDSIRTAGRSDLQRLVLD